MYCKARDYSSIPWGDSIREHETTTFERIDGLHQMYNVYHKCTECGRYVLFPITLEKDKIDYNFCPYCSRPVESE